MARQRPIAGQRARSRAGAGDARGEQSVAATRPAGRTSVLDAPALAARRPEPEHRPDVRHDEPRAAQRGRRGDLWTLVAVAVVLALAVTAGLLVLRAQGEDRVQQARSEAVAAAERHAVTVLSYDHRRLDQDFAAARRVLTGSFADDYAATTQRVVRPSAEQVEAVVTAEVAASSVVEAGENRVVVLLFVDQTTTSNRLDGPKVDLNRVRMTMQRTGGDWKVAGIDAL